MEPDTFATATPASRLAWTSTCADVVSQTGHRGYKNRHELAAQSDSMTPIKRLPVEAIDVILGWLNDRDFWRARQAHRIFRLDHPKAVLRNRAIYWWLRTGPEEVLRRRRGDIFLLLYRRKRVPSSFSPWPDVMRSGDVALFDAVRTVVPFPIYATRRRMDLAIERGHLALVMHVHACYPRQFVDSDFAVAVQRNQIAIALALARLDPTRPQRLVECAAYHGSIACVSALFDQHRAALSLGGVATAAASNGQVHVLDALAPFIDEPAQWVPALMTASARNSVGSVRWIMEATHQPRDVLRRALTVARAHDSFAVVSALLHAQPDLSSGLDLVHNKCTLKGACALIQSIPSDQLYPAICC